MKKRIEIFIRSVYAGFMIGIGGIVNLSVDNKIIGSLLFSFGLMTIVTQSFYLYTGKIGFVEKAKELIDMIVIIMGNFVGTFLVAQVARIAGLSISSTEMVQKKLDNNILHIFLLAMMCGVLMYLAIDSYNKTKNIVFVIAPVMIFILSGFEHSVADMFYINLAGIHSLRAYGYLMVMLVGNGLGAWIFGLKPWEKRG